MTRLKDLKRRLMKDPEFREEYARADDEFALIEALVCARTAAKLTQGDLARRLNTTQPDIARLEDGEESPSVAILRCYVSLVPKQTLGSGTALDRAYRTLVNWHDDAIVFESGERVPQT